MCIYRTHHRLSAEHVHTHTAQSSSGHFTCHSFHGALPEQVYLLSMGTMSCHVHQTSHLWQAEIEAE